MKKLLILLAIIGLLASCESGNERLIIYKSIIIETPAYSNYIHKINGIYAPFIDSTNKYNIGDTIK